MGPHGQRFSLSLPAVPRTETYPSCQDGSSCCVFRHTPLRKEHTDKEEAAEKWEGGRGPASWFQVWVSKVLDLQVSLSTKARPGEDATEKLRRL